MKLLTVSVAAYNVEKYLENTLNSLMVDNILAKSLEVIIVDDGSKDRTREIALRYCSLFPDTFKLISKNNGGYGSTINASLLVATGKYYKQLDGDDWFNNNNLKNFLVFLENTSADLIISPYTKCFESGEKETIDDCIYINDSSIHPISVLNQGNCIAMHELTIKTELLKKSGFHMTENCFYTDNEYTFFSLLEAKKFAKFGQEIYCYRLGLEGQSVSIGGANKHYKDTIRVAFSLYKKYTYCHNNEIEALLRKYLLAITNSVYTYHLVCNSDGAKNELACFDKALRHNYHEIYKLSNKIKKIRILRLSKFCLFSLIKKKVSSEWI